MANVREIGGEDITKYFANVNAKRAEYEKEVKLQEKHEDMMKKRYDYVKEKYRDDFKNIFFKINAELESYEFENSAELTTKITKEYIDYLCDFMDGRRNNE